MLEAIISFAIGFIISYVIIYYHQRKLDLAYLLTTIKEDIVNLHVIINKITQLPEKEKR